MLVTQNVERAGIAHGPHHHDRPALAVRIHLPYDDRVLWLQSNLFEVGHAVAAILIANGARRAGRRIDCARRDRDRRKICPQRKSACRVERCGKRCAAFGEIGASVVHVAFDEDEIVGRETNERVRRQSEFRGEVDG